MSPQVRLSLRMRRLILERAKFCCEYCHSPTAYSPEIFEVEHVIPTSRGGKTTLANLALACPACNRYKANRVEAIDPVTEQLSPLYNPRTQEWTVHFQWNNLFTTIVGQTALGRATIETLRMNREAVEYFRKALVQLNLHPDQTS